MDKQFLEQNGLDVETINQVVKGFQKAGENYNGIQCAIALEILLRAVCPDPGQQESIKEIVDNFFNIDFDANR